MAHRGIPGTEASRSAAGAGRHLVFSASVRATQGSETERERMHRKKPESSDRSMNCHHHLDLPRWPILLVVTARSALAIRSRLRIHPKNRKQCGRSQRRDCRGAIRQIGPVSAESVFHSFRSHPAAAARLARHRPPSPSSRNSVKNLFFRAAESANWESSMRRVYAFVGFSLVVSTAAAQRRPAD